MQLRESEALMQMKQPRKSSLNSAAMAFDPRHMDAAWELVNCLERRRDPDAEPVFPYALKQAWFREHPDEAFFLYVVRRDPERFETRSAMSKYDVYFCDQEGEVFSALNDFSVLDRPRLSQVRL